MFPTETSKGTEFLVFIVGGIILAIVIIVAAVALKISDRPDNPETNVESNIAEDNEADIDWGFIIDKKDYVSEDKGEVYLLTFEQVIDGKKYQRTDRVTQSTYDKFTIGDKYYRARYTEDGIKTFEERGNKDDSLYSNG